MLASVAIDQYCSRLTSSCARFAECRDGVFDRLLRHPDVPHVTTRLTARELLHVDGNELLGARRLTSGFQAVSGTMFHAELIPGLSLTSFSRGICEGSPEMYCSPWQLQCEFMRALGRRIRGSKVHRLSDAVLCIGNTQHDPSAGAYAQGRVGVRTAHALPIRCVRSEHACMRRIAKWRVCCR